MSFSAEPEDIKSMGMARTANVLQLSKGKLAARAAGVSPTTIAEPMPVTAMVAGLSKLMKVARKVGRREGAPCQCGLVHVGRLQWGKSLTCWGDPRPVLLEIKLFP